MTKMVKDKKDQRGASAIEFAIVLPVLLALLFGIIELRFPHYCPGKL